MVACFRKGCCVGAAREFVSCGMWQQAAECLEHVKEEARAARIYECTGKVSASLHACSTLVTDGPPCHRRVATQVAPERSTSMHKQDVMCFRWK
jgi:hypothetical protein